MGVDWAHALQTSSKYHQTSPFVKSSRQTEKWLTQKYLAADTKKLHLAIPQLYLVIPWLVATPTYTPAIPQLHPGCTWNRWKGRVYGCFLLYIDGNVKLRHVEMVWKLTYSLRISLIPAKTR